jgi:hypothetical protein
VQRYESQHDAGIGEGRHESRHFRRWELQNRTLGGPEDRDRQRAHQEWRSRSGDRGRERQCGSLPRFGLTVYLTPVLFGHFSSTIKDAIDRGTGSREWQMVIGYGTDVYDEERSTFIDLTAKHCGSNDIVHPGMVARADAFVPGSLEENAAICEGLTRDLTAGGVA